MLCIYGNRQNLGTIRKDENALWSLGVHDLSVILYLVGEEPDEAWAHGNAFLNAGRRGRRLLLPALPERQDRAHAPLVARPAQDAEDHRRRPRQDGRVRRHGAGAQGDGLREGVRGAVAQTYGEWRTRTGDIFSPKIPNDEPLRLEIAHFLRLVRGEARRGARGARRARGRAHARAAAGVARRRPSVDGAEIHESAIVYPGTVLGEGVKVLEGAVVGKQPSLSPRSTAKREPLPPTEIGDGTIVSTGAIVFAGTRIGARVILGDQSCVRERVTIGDDVVLGRGSLIENDTTVGALTKIQAERLHHRVLDARGQRLHRAVRRDDERQLHGPHRAAPRADQGADDPPRRARRRRRGSLPGDRDRRGGVRRRGRGRDEGRPAARRSSSATRRACCARSPRTNCSRTSSAFANSRFSSTPPPWVGPHPAALNDDVTGESRAGLRQLCAGSAPFCER